VPTQGEYSVVQFGLVLLVGAYVYVSERFARHNFAWDVRISSARGADRDILKGRLGIELYYVILKCIECIA
jgi:hypothetical protein